MLDICLNSYHFIISNVVPAGMEHSGRVDVGEPLHRPGRAVDLNPGPGYPHCAILHSTTSHHDRVTQVDAACPTEIMLVEFVTLTEVTIHCVVW